ncbi:MAG: hypothetical protein IPJ92_02925 [Veillonella sp.]|nr:hypothetical protein [Veillonella sp.]
MGSPAEMGELADHLKDNHQVILIATRGHGRSEIGHTTMSFEQKADDVHAVLQGWCGCIRRCESKNTGPRW